MHKIVAAPVGAVRRVPHHCREAVRTRRIGNLTADRGLDVLTFFIADVQTGFGPFISVYLAANAWSVAAVGSALGLGTIVAMIAQVPAGAAIDAVPLKRGATLLALLAVLGSAVTLALLPQWGPVLGAEVLHGIAAAMLVPAVAAVTLTRVGREGFAQRLGRNARCMALGNGLGAVLMGTAGAKLSPSAPFWIAAASTIPAIFALLALPPRHSTQPRPPRRKAREATHEGWRVLRDRRLLAFMLCVVLFQAANAFILPLAMARLAKSGGGASSNLTLAACLLVSQGVVAALAPWLGRRAEDWGRRPVLLLGFAAVPLHALLLAVFGGAPIVIGTELLDGIGAAMFGVMMPLVAADVARGSNRFNLILGVLGLAIGLGGTASAGVGGWLADRAGDSAAFLALTMTGLVAVAAVALLMPETRAPRQQREAESETTPSRSASA